MEPDPLLLEYINQTHHSSVLASSCFSMCIDVIVDLFQGPPSKRHHSGGYLHLNHMPGMRGSSTLNFSGQSPWLISESGLNSFTFHLSLNHASTSSMIQYKHTNTLVLTDPPYRYTCTSMRTKSPTK